MNSRNYVLIDERKYLRLSPQKEGQKVLTHLIGRLYVSQKGEEGGNINLCLQTLQGAGAPVLELVSLGPIGGLVATALLLAALLLTLFLGIGVTVVVIVVVVGVLVVVVRLLWLLRVVGRSYHRFPESLRSHDIHRAVKKSPVTC